jgi:AIG1 family
MATVPRILLIGASGVGKSTTANLLVGDAARPFETSHGGKGETKEVAARASAAHGWVVVDTPGFGDQQPKEKNDTPEQHAEKGRVRRTKFFNDITTELRTNGGTILYCARAGRTSTTAQNQLKALSYVISHQFSSTVWLVLTDVPEEYLYYTDDSDSKRMSKHTEYEKWLADQRSSTEAPDSLGVEFVSALGLSDEPDLHADHPANAANFIQQLQQVDLLSFSVTKGTTLLWNDIVSDAYTIEQAIATIDTAIAATEKKLVQLALQIPHLATMLILNPSLRTILLPTIPLLLLPSIPLLLLHSRLREYWQNSLMRTLEEQRKQRACYDVSGPSELRIAAAELEKLVHDA